MSVVSITQSWVGVLDEIKLMERLLRQRFIPVEDSLTPNTKVVNLTLS